MGFAAAAGALCGAGGILRAWFRIASLVGVRPVCGESRSFRVAARSPGSPNTRQACRTRRYRSSGSRRGGSVPRSRGALSLALVCRARCCFHVVHSCHLVPLGTGGLARPDVSGRPPPANDAGPRRDRVRARRVADARTTPGLSRRLSWRATERRWVVRSSRRDSPGLGL